jgi:contact-dependent growth inhibition (CDI) system CdiI-like immunity protein
MTTPHPKGPQAAAITAADFPALRTFLRGYFHQDMKDEYDTPEEAVREFCADASTDERNAVAKEWSRFMDQTKSKPLQEINRILTGPLGSSCILTSEDLERISAVLSRTSGKPGPR